MPTSFRIDQSDEVAEFVGKGLNSAVDRGLFSAGMRLVGIIQNEIIPSRQPPPVFNRHYSAAWQLVKSDEGFNIVNTLPYAPVIEFGARPENIKIGRAMIDALTEWVITKGIVGHPKTDSQKAQAAINARAIAWAIATSMKKKGIFNRDGRQGLRIAEEASARAPEIVVKEIVREIKRGQVA